jgi:2'-5' RNA ligase
MRCFIACELPERAKTEMSSALSQLRNRAPFLKWVKAENLHFTVKFLGDVEENRIPGIQTELRGLSSRLRPFTLRMGSLGKFGSPADLRVLWVGLEEGGERLSEIAGSVEGAMETLGFSREDRPFRSHLTLARSRRGSRDRANMEDFRGITVPTDPITVDSLVLFRSQLTPEGPIYTELERFPFHE